MSKFFLYPQCKLFTKPDSPDTPCPKCAAPEEPEVLTFPADVLPFLRERHEQQEDQHVE